MSVKILCGVHTLKERNGESYYPVAVYLDVSKKYAERETCLLRSARSTDIETVWAVIEKDMEECTEEGVYEWPHFVGNHDTENIPGSLDGLRLYHPTKNKIGEEVQGTVVGWHIDYRTNAGKSSNPVILGNVCFHDHLQRVNFVTVAKHHLDKAPTNQELVSLMAVAFEKLSDKFKLGGSCVIDIVPVGKERARFVMREYVKPRAFTVDEVLVNALREAIIS